jgi:PAS domain S-box-containing protein
MSDPGPRFSFNTSKQTLWDKWPWSHPLKATIVVIAFTVAAVILRMGINPWVGSHVPYPTVFIAAAGAAWLAGWVAGTITSIAAALWCMRLFSMSASAPPATGTLITEFLVVLLTSAIVVGLVEVTRRSRTRFVQLADKLENLLDAVPTPIIIVRDKTVTDFVLNQAARKLLGLEGVELRNLDRAAVAQRIKTYSNGVLVEESELPIRQAIAGDKRIEHRLMEISIDDGPLRTLDVTAVPIHDADGSVRGAIAVAHDLTDRILMDERISLAETAGGMGFFEADLKAGTAVITPGLERIFGYPPGTFPGTVKAWYDQIHPEDLERMMGDRDEIRKYEHFLREYRLIRLDGVVRWLHVRGHLETDAHGKVVRMVGVVFDFTDRKMSEDQMNTILASIEDHLVTYDRNFRYVFINEAGAKMLGKTREELIGRSIFDVFPDAIGNQYDRELRRALKEQIIIRSEHYYEPFDRWFENHFYPSESGVTVFSSDITQRKRIQEAAQTARDLLALITDNLPPLIAYIDREFRYRLNNRAYEEWFGLSREEITGKTVEEVLGPDAWNALKPHMEGALAGRKEVFESHINYRTAGMRWVQAQYVPQFAADGHVEGFAVLVEDISKRKEEEQKLRLSEATQRKLAEELAEADQRKDEFLATLAHELRNPLSPIRSSVDLLKHSHDEKTLDGCLTIIDRQLRHLTRLVDDLLDVSRISRGKLPLRKSTLVLQEVLESAIEATQPLITQRNHIFTVSMPDQPILFDADPVRLTQIIVNLLNNAAKFSPKGGRIQLTAALEEGVVVISVRDEGIGIAQEKLTELFSIFYQAEPAGQSDLPGLGIGLYLVRKLVELHGGSLQAHSRGEGMGSTFTVRFPIDTPVPSEPTNPKPDAAPVEAVKRKILIVDDNRDSAEVLCLLLTSQGHDVETAYDGESAIRQFQTFEPDVILMDIGMPGMDGYETCRAIRALPKGNTAMILAQTGWGQDEDRFKSKEAGFDAHLVKPVEIDELSEILGKKARQSLNP